MENLKKKLFTIGVIFSLSLGLIFSFVPDADAQEIVVFGEAELTDIPCHSSAVSMKDHTYTACDTCKRVKNYKGQDPQGMCTPNARAASF